MTYLIRSTFKQLTTVAEKFTKDNMISLNIMCQTQVYHVTKFKHQSKKSRHIS